MTGSSSRPEFFISYSRSDANLVAPVVALLRASRAHVFRDADSLQPGKKWREQLSTAISDSRMIVLFWCHHAHQSAEVCNEYSEAISMGKDLLPLLLDDTPLPSTLAEYQFIDFRGAFPHGHAEDVAPVMPAENRIAPSAQEAAPKSSRRSWIIGLAATVFGLIALPVAYMVTVRNPGSVVPDTSSCRISPPDGTSCAVPELLIVRPSFIPWVLGAAVLLLAIFFWRRRRRGRQSTPTVSTWPADSGFPDVLRAPAPDRVQVMASVIESELSRRLVGQ